MLSTPYIDYDLLEGTVLSTPHIDYDRLEGTVLSTPHIECYHAWRVCTWRS